MKEIHFATKEDNNKRREQEFYNLEPTERFRMFLKLVQSLNVFQSKPANTNKENFIIYKK